MLLTALSGSRAAEEHGYGRLRFLMTWALCDLRFVRAKNDEEHRLLVGDFWMRRNERDIHSCEGDFGKLAVSNSV